LAQTYGHWHVIKSLSEGGQAHTFLVEREPSDGKHVLKRLKNLNRVGRFRAEVTAGLMEMVAKKRGPTLTTVAGQVRRSVPGDSPWRYLVAQLSKLPGDSVFAPQRVLRPELANQGP
jgi:hypothetical protein